MTTMFELKRVIGVAISMSFMQFGCASSSYHHSGDYLNKKISPVAIMSNVCDDASPRHKEMRSKMRNQSPASYESAGVTVYITAYDVQTGEYEGLVASDGNRIVFRGVGVDSVTIVSGISTFSDYVIDNSLKGAWSNLAQTYDEQGSMLGGRYVEVLRYSDELSNSRELYCYEEFNKSIR